jgi:hypothetical protein
MIPRLSCALRLQRYVRVFVMLSAFVQVQLTDDELWHAIVQNTDSMSALIHQQVDLETSLAGPDDPAERTRLMRANQQQIDRSAREYAAYTAEIRRRYPF